MTARVLHDFVPSPEGDVCAECTWHRGDPSQHPQPARETPADDLAEAKALRAMADHMHPHDAIRVRRVLDQLDERGREMERLRPLVQAAQRWVAHMEGSRDVCMGPAADLIAAVDALAGKGHPIGSGRHPDTPTDLRD